MRRTGGTKRPELLPGNDGGCFESALQNVRRCGGVLEHPAGTSAWKAFGIFPPNKPQSRRGWLRISAREWVCAVWQSAYGHKCRKSTWLYYVGNRSPFQLRWDRTRGSHQVGGQDQRGRDRNKPTVSKKEASATPLAFAEELIRLALWSREPAVKRRLHLKMRG